MGLFCALNFCIVCPFPSHAPLGFSFMESSSKSCASKSRPSSVGLDYNQLVPKEVVVGAA